MAIARVMVESFDETFGDDDQFGDIRANFGQIPARLVYTFL
jgi:hypothetical protein